MRTLEERYQDHLRQLSSTQHEGMHEDDADNVPMTREEFAEYEAYMETESANDGPFGRIV